MKKIRNKLMTLLACLGITALFFFLGVTAEQQTEGEQ